MASDGEDLNMTASESEVSAAENETDIEDAPVPELETDDDLVEVEAVPLSTDEAEMEELLTQLEDYTPTLPDALTLRILNSVSKSEYSTFNCLLKVSVFSLALALWTRESFASFLSRHKNSSQIL